MEFLNKVTEVTALLSRAIGNNASLAQELRDEIDAGAKQNSKLVSEVYKAVLADLPKVNRTLRKLTNAAETIQRVVMDVYADLESYQSSKIGVTFIKNVQEIMATKSNVSERLIQAMSEQEEEFVINSIIKECNGDLALVDKRIEALEEQIDILNSYRAESDVWFDSNFINLLEFRLQCARSAHNKLELAKAIKSMNDNKNIFKIIEKKFDNNF